MEDAKKKPSKTESAKPEDDEEEVLKEGELPKKYAFLSLPHEEKTP